jgi:hypothetical protein
MQWHGGITCVCHCVVKIVSSQLQAEKNRPQSTKKLCYDDKSSIVISISYLTQQVRIPPTKQGCAFIYRDPPNTSATSVCMGGVRLRLQRGVCVTTIKTIKIKKNVHCLLKTSCKSGFPLPTKDARPSTQTHPTHLLPLIVFEGLAGIGRGDFIIMIKIDDFVRRHRRR